MDAGWATVLAAAIAGTFGLLTVLVARFAKENRADHAVVQGILRGMHKTIYRTEDKIDKVNDKLSEHLENHKK
jgi:hypothetical protein